MRIVYLLVFICVGNGKASASLYAMSRLTSFKNELSSFIQLPRQCSSAFTRILNTQLRIYSTPYMFSFPSIQRPIQTITSGPATHQLFLFLSLSLSLSRSLSLSLSLSISLALYLSISLLLSLSPSLVLNAFSLYALSSLRSAAHDRAAVEILLAFSTCVRRIISSGKRHRASTAGRVCRKRVIPFSCQLTSFTAPYRAPRSGSRARRFMSFAR